MCSINEEDLEIMPELNIGNEPLSKTCRKCSVTGSVVLRKKDVYCVNCFVTAVNHKFRANLGKNKTIRANQKVSVAISGGLASSVLLNFVYNGLSEDTHKKLRMNVVCIHINDDSSNATNMETCNAVLEQCKQYGLPLYIANLSSVLDQQTPVLKADTIPTVDLALCNKLESLISNISSPTSQIDFLVKLRRKLLLQCSQQLECCFVLTGDISTTLASSMLSNLALGRGAHVENDVGFCDSRDLIKILKPIKDITLEEVNLYADITKISYAPKVLLGKNTIQSTIEKFVNGLQENFPATISTICKTGEKMGKGHDTVNSITENECIICQSELDTHDINSSALQATEFSRVVSSTGPSRACKVPVEVTSGCGNCHCTKEPVGASEVEKWLCYGCRLILRDAGDGNLSDYLQSIVKNKIAMDKLRSEINDFLI